MQRVGMWQFAVRVVELGVGSWPRTQRVVVMLVGFGVLVVLVTLPGWLPLVGVGRVAAWVSFAVAGWA